LKAKRKKNGIEKKQGKRERKGGGIEEESE
jgi:hypothetical protein